MCTLYLCVSPYYSFRRKVETLDQNVEGLRGHLQQLVTIARTYCKAGNAFCEHGRELSSALMHLQVCCCIYICTCDTYTAAATQKAVDMAADTVIATAATAVRALLHIASVSTQRSP
jgi:hypothetical protein